MNPTGSVSTPNGEDFVVQDDEYDADVVDSFDDLPEDEPADDGDESDQDRPLGTDRPVPLEPGEILG